MFNNLLSTVFTNNLNNGANFGDGGGEIYTEDYSNSARTYEKHGFWGRLGEALGLNSGDYNREFQAKEAEATRQYNSAEAVKTRDFNAEEAQKARDYDKEKAKNSYQWAVEDLKAAGLNPILAAGNGGYSGGGSAMATSSQASSNTTTSGTTGSGASQLINKLVDAVIMIATKKPTRKMGFGD